MKRIVIDINSIIPYILKGKTSGTGRTTLELVNSLTNIKNQIPFEIVLYSQNMKGIGGKNIETPFGTQHFYLPHREMVNKWFGRLPVKEILIPYDLLHIPHSFEYIFKPEKTIFTLHDALFMRMNEKAYNHLGMRVQVPPVMHKCKGIITCSESSKRDIVNTMDINPNKIDVVYWGINNEVFYPHKDKNMVKESIFTKFGIVNSYFISVSCSAERKNTHKLVEAYLELSKQNPANDLVLAWSNPPDFVLKMIKNGNISHRVHILSNIPDQELALLYNGAASLIFPSSYEGFGLPVLEAMACGTPVVTCNNSSLPEVGSDSVLYIDEPTTENILTYLESFENHELDLVELSEKGIKQAAKFHWENTANQYLKIYSKYLDS